MTEHTIDEHHHDDHHGHHNDPESIHREKRKYLIVFGALAVLTIITVAVARLDLPPMETILVALAIATVKGALVAAFFMHLISERKLIYGVLVLTVFFFGVLVWGPWHHKENSEHTWPEFDQTNKPAPTGTAKAGAHH